MMRSAPERRHEPRRHPTRRRRSDHDAAHGLYPHDGRARDGLALRPGRAAAGSALLLEVLELDAQERHERRITRLRRASKLVLYVVPATSVSGAILLVGYLGGAVATHVRVGNPLASHVLFPMYV